MDKFEWEMVEIDHSNNWIPFEWMDRTPGGSNLGRAEFLICIKFKRGRISEFWVYPRQQRNAKQCWHYSGGDNCFQISSHDNLENANVWLITYCPEHKTQTISLYVPRESKFLMIDYYGISFTNHKWGE